MRKLVPMAAAGSLMLAALGGCAYTDAALGYAEGKVDQAISQKRRQSDIEAEAVRNIPCLMTVGAYYRTLSERERAAVDVLCGGDSGDPFAAGDAPDG